MVLNAIKQEYGCRLTGQFTVKEVPGNFHISMHAYYNLFMMLKLDGVITGLEMSHTIHQLYFGHEHHIDKIR